MQPALRELGLARERLRFRAQLGEPGSMLLDLGAHARKLALHLGGRAQPLEHAVGFARGGRGLVAAGRQPRLGFGQRRQPGGVASDLAFGGGMELARRECRVLALAPARPGGCIGLGGGRRLRLGRVCNAALDLDVLAQRLELGLDIGEPVLAGKPSGRAGRCIGGDREAVPTPEIAVGRNQPLAGLEQRRQARRVLAHDHADLSEPARQLRRCPDMLGERLDACGQLRIARLDGGAGPAHGSRGVDRGLEIVAQRGPERAFEAFVDRETVDDAGPEILGIDMEQPGERLGFSVVTMHAALGLDERRAGDIERLAGG
jgi:hypothetical protein